MYAMRGVFFTSVVILSACSANRDIRSDGGSWSKTDRIELGMTVVQAEGILGKPAGIKPGDASNDTECRVYKYLHRGRHERNSEVIFTSGRVSEFADNKFPSNVCRLYPQTKTGIPITNLAPRY